MSWNDARLASLPSSLCFFRHPSAIKTSNPNRGLPDASLTRSYFEDLGSSLRDLEGSVASVSPGCSGDSRLSSHTLVSDVTANASDGPPIDCSKHPGLSSQTSDLLTGILEVSNSLRTVSADLSASSRNEDDQLHSNQTLEGVAVSDELSNPRSTDMDFWKDVPFVPNTLLGDSNDVSAQDTQSGKTISEGQDHIVFAPLSGSVGDLISAFEEDEQEVSTADFIFGEPLWNSFKPRTVVSTDQNHINVSDTPLTLTENYRSDSENRLEVVAASPSNLSSSCCNDSKLSYKASDTPPEALEDVRNSRPEGSDFIDVSPVYAKFTGSILEDLIAFEEQQQEISTVGAFFDESEG